MPTNVLHIISSSGFYGAENVLINIMRSMQDEGVYAPHVFCLKNRGTADPDIYGRAKAKVIKGRG